jgi:hypothetical protein
MSSPAPPLMTSLPSPASTVSLPAPVSIRSSPPRVALIVSLPPLLSIWSLPGVSLKLSAWFALASLGLGIILPQSSVPGYTPSAEGFVSKGPRSPIILKVVCGSAGRSGSGSIFMAGSASGPVRLILRLPSA